MVCKFLELQGKLADLNLVVDKLSTDTSKEDVELETKELRGVNERRKAALEQIFEERRQREAQITQLEKEIQQVMCTLKNITLLSNVQNTILNF